MNTVYVVYEQGNEDPLAICLNQKALVRVMHKEWEENPDANIWWDEMEAEK